MSHARIHRIAADIRALLIEAVGRVPNGLVKQAALRFRHRNGPARDSHLAGVTDGMFLPPGRRDADEPERRRQQQVLALEQRRYLIDLRRSALSARAAGRRRS
jgi:hypothetical protein